MASSYTPSSTTPFPITAGNIQVHYTQLSRPNRITSQHKCAPWLTQPGGAPSVSIRLPAALEPARALPIRPFEPLELGDRGLVRCPRTRAGRWAPARGSHPPRRSWLDFGTCRVARLRA